MCDPQPKACEIIASRFRKTTFFGRRTSNWIETSLNIYRDLRDQWFESVFHSVYGFPALQALAGFKASDASPRRRPGSDAIHKAFVAQRIEELRNGISEGGPREAAIRAALYIRMPEGVADE